jgi:spore germination cell wall hydrolase CwlJ-like protein
MRTILLLLAMVPMLLGQEIVPTGDDSAYHALQERNKEEKCLATMVYGESRSEPLKGMVAVAYTALTRSIKRNKTVCDTVLAPKQYSIFNNNPALKAAAMSTHLVPMQKNEIDNRDWETSLRVAKIVLAKEVEDPTKGATHYIAPIVMKQKRYTIPTWTKTFVKMGKIGNHVFFKEKDRT